MKFILNLLQQVILLILLIGGGFFAYANQEKVLINLPFFSSAELPLWLVCFAAAFIGFAACFIILRSISLSHFTFQKKNAHEIQ